MMFFSYIILHIAATYYLTEEGEFILAQQVRAHLGGEDMHSA